MNLQVDELYLNSNVYIASSDIHRWGVFTKKPIAQYDVIQESPYCTFPAEELENAATLERYTYAADCTSEVDEVVLGFGFAAMFNHSSDPNVAYILDPVNEVMRHYAIVDIDAEEELVIDYGCDEDDDWGDY